MSLVLNDFEVKGSELRVAATLSLAGENISGQSSATTIAETGDKPKQLSVSLLIKFVDANNLTNIVNLAENKDAKGERLTYDIINPTADAMYIRKVRFLGDLSVREDETHALWRVSFKLTEVQSVAEAKEARLETPGVTDQAPTGETTQPVNTADDLTWFEKIIKDADDWIGGVTKS